MSETNFRFPVIIILRDPSSSGSPIDFVDKHFDVFAPRSKIESSDLLTPWDADVSILSFKVHPSQTHNANVMFGLAVKNLGQRVETGGVRTYTEFKSGEKVLVIAPPATTQDDSSKYLPTLFPRKATFRWVDISHGKEIAQRAEVKFRQHRYSMDLDYLRKLGQFRYTVLIGNGTEMNELMAELVQLSKEYGASNIPGDALDWTKCEHGQWYDAEWHLPKNTACLLCAARY